MHVTLQNKLSAIRAWNDNKACLDIANDSGFSLFKVWEFERGSIDMMHLPKLDVERLASAYGILPSLLNVLQDDEYEARVCGYGIDLLPDQARRILSERNFVILDTETTGKDNLLSSIVEIAIVGSDGQEMLNSYVRPQMTIPAEATAIHHITDEMVEDAPTFREIFPRIAECIQDKIVVVYNADYDITLIQSLARRYELALPEFEPICLMVLYANHWRLQSKGLTNKWQSLSNACKQQGVALEDAHRAMNDTLATYRLLMKLAQESEA